MVKYIEKGWCTNHRPDAHKAGRQGSRVGPTTNKGAKAKLIVAWR